jgi:regulator of protease activity HflC (stomatin/prohibitin superfamily)
LRYSGWSEGLHKDVKNEGFYFTWPWADNVVYGITWKSRTEEVEILTADGLHVPTRVSVTFRPRRSDLYRLATQLGPTYYQDVIQPAFRTLMRAEFAKYRHNEIPGRSPEIEQSMAEKL